MNDTSLSLLDRVKRGESTDSWNRLVELYTPLIRHWLGRCFVSRQDRDDLVQEVMAVVVRRVPTFEHNRRTGAFRNWLRTVTTNCAHDYCRKKKPVARGDSEFNQLLHQLEDPESDLNRIWEDEHDDFVLQSLLKMLQGEFRPNTWNAFYQVAVEGAEAQAVADELGISLNAVFIAKSRVLSRLRQEAEGLVD